MNFGVHFNHLSILKAKTHKHKVSSISEYDRIILRDMPEDLRRFISTDDIIVKPSVGQGNYSDVPWICLLSTNASISPSAQKGIYIVLLFNKIGDAFYLCLSQGITNFNQMKLTSQQKKEIIAKTVQYFQTEIPLEMKSGYGFSYSKMDLGEEISTLAKGYIQTTIVSKRYEVSHFDQNDFYRSLSYLLKEYDEIVANIGTKSYDDVIAIINPLQYFDKIDDAIEKIHNVLKKVYVENRDISQKPIKVNRGEMRPNKYNRIAQERIYSKIDYLEKAREQYQTGLKGEDMALKIERARLENLGLDPNIYVRHCSVVSDSYGYDFESVDIRKNRITKIYVEVKATKDYKDSSFFVSKNEHEVSKIKRDTYRIFRIFDITSITPKYYFADGEIEDNFYLDPVTFSAKYKYKIE